MIRLLILTFLLAIWGSALAQTSKTDGQNPAGKGGPTSLSPFQSDQVYHPRASSKAKARKNLSPEAEFAQRMQAVVKARQKQEIKMRKPQYSNPLYFGHKRKPKKHSPKKMKFCNECGIRH